MPPTTHDLLDVTLGASVTFLAEQIGTALHTEDVAEALTELTAPGDGILPAAAKVLAAAADFLLGLGTGTDPHHARQLQQLAADVEQITQRAALIRHQVADRHTAHPYRTTCAGVGPGERESLTVCSCSPPVPPPVAAACRRAPSGCNRPHFGSGIDRNRQESSCRPGHRPPPSASSRLLEFLLIVVISAARAALEDALAARGEPVLAVVPEAVLAERRALAAGRYEVRAVSDWADLGQLVRLADALSGLPVRAVETTDEACLRPAALLRGLLQTDRGLTWAQAVAATDKAVQKDLLVRAGVPVAGHRRISAVAEAAHAADQHLGWPVVVKPRRGFGTLGTRLVRDQNHLAELLTAGAFAGTDGLPASMTASGLHRPLDEIPGGLLAEALVRVRAEYHIELLRHQGQELYAISARYVAPVLGSPLVGSVLLQPGPEHDATTALARAAADALNLTTGFAHVEVLLDNDGVWRVGEIGLRPGGARVPDLLRLHHHIDVPDLAADLATGNHPKVQLSQAGHTTAWVSAVTPSGTVTAITPTEEIRRLPGVIDAHTDLHPGATAGGPHGSTALATHVYTQGATAQDAEQAALAAITAWRVDIAVPAEHQPA